MIQTELNLTPKPELCNKATKYILENLNNQNFIDQGRFKMTAHQVEHSGVDLHHMIRTKFSDVFESIAQQVTDALPDTRLVVYNHYDISHAYIEVI